jgi:hypothetical protein
MGFKLCFLVMNVRPEAQPRRALCEAIPNLLERWQAEFFSPRALHLWLDGGEAIELTRFDAARSVRTQPLWQDEVVEDGQSLTRCSPAQGSSLIAEAAALLTERQPRTLYLSAEGALHHRAAGDTQPHWYGRWVITEPPTLSELIKIRIEWTEERRNLELSFHLSGYPLTSVTPLPSGNLGAGDSKIAAANRALIIPALAYAPLSFGLAPGEVRWIDDGDYAGLYPEDAASLREHWLPRLESGELVGDSQAERNGSEAAPTMPDGNANEVADILAKLSAGAPQRLWALDELAYEPTGNPRVVAAIEAALDDRTPCRIEQYYLGEARLLAALALTAERAVSGSTTPVRLRSVPPVRAADLMVLLERAGVPWPEPTDTQHDAGVIAFATARERGLIVEREMELSYPVDLAALAGTPMPDPFHDDAHVAAFEPTTPPEAAPSAKQPQETEQDVQFYLNTFQRGTRDDRAFALQVLARSPKGDRRIRDALIPLLYDTTPCLLQIPYRFGELRLLAGAALAAERWAAGDKRPVRLRCIAPVTSDDLEKLQAAARITPPPYAGNPIEHQLSLFALLREHGLPEVELELRHPVHLGWITTGQEEASELQDSSKYDERGEQS